MGRRKGILASSWPHASDLKASLRDDTQGTSCPLCFASGRMDSVEPGPKCGSHSVLILRDGGLWKILTSSEEDQ